MKILIAVLAVIALMILSMVFKNVRTPSSIGLENGKFAPMPKSPNAVSSQTDIEEKQVEPFPFKGSLEETKEAVKKALSDYGSVKIREEKPNYIHAVHTTGTMHYHDDLEFYFDEEKKVVHFRSASRVGYSDMGLNRERYNSLIELYKYK